MTPLKTQVPPELVLELLDRFPDTPEKTHEATGQAKLLKFLVSQVEAQTSTRLETTRVFVQPTESTGHRLSPGSNPSTRSRSRSR